MNRPSRLAIPSEGTDFRERDTVSSEGVPSPAPSSVLSPSLRFPAGLEQPEGSFRFSVDALLLAAFAARRSGVRGRFADLGTGCGVVGLGFARLMPGWSGAGLECDAALTEAANRNALRLECPFTTYIGDCTDQTSMRTMRHELGAVDLVMANPPWRLRGTGRLPASKTRAQALFGDERTLGAFASAAAILLKERGCYACTAGVHRLPDTLDAVRAAGLSPTRLLLVHPNAQAAASLFFLEAHKGMRTQMRIEAPLFLYDASRSLRPEVLEFCPFLR